MRQHGSELSHLEGEEDRAGGGAPALESGKAPTPGIDSVVVVRPDESAHDTSVWETGAGDFLPLGVPISSVLAKSDKSGWGGGEQALSMAFGTSEPRASTPEPAIEHVTYRRRKKGEKSVVVVDSFVAEQSCGDEYAVSEDEREAYLAEDAERTGEPDDEDDGPEERSAADLLNESGSAWGGPTATWPTGVIE